MGRQISAKLSYEDEQSLLDQLRQDGFVVVPERVPSPRIWDHIWEKLPSDDQAEPWEYPSAILPSILARTRQACFGGLPSQLDTRPQGSIPSRLAYLVNTRCLPAIDWYRNRRSAPRTVRIPGSGGRFFVDTRRDYGPDEKWKEAVIGEYDKIVKLIKKWTISTPRFGYWSKRLDRPPPSDEEYEQLLQAQRRASKAQ
jgi:hypothetical protein